jgi:hypothetical protein
MPLSTAFIVSIDRAGPLYLYWQEDRLNRYGGCHVKISDLVVEAIIESLIL